MSDGNFVMAVLIFALLAGITFAFATKGRLRALLWEEPTCELDEDDESVRWVQ